MDRQINPADFYTPTAYKMEPGSGTIPNISRVKRVLKLIAYLNQWRSIKEIAACIEVSKKTVHRYISLLIEVGFVVEQQRRRRVTYRVANVAEYFGITVKVDRLDD